MHEAVLSWPLVLIVGGGVLGLYLLLSTGQSGSRRRIVQLAGIGLSGLSLVLLAVFWGRQLGWPTEAHPESPVSSLMFFLFGGLSLIAAAFTVTSEKASNSVLWFALMLLANAGLFAMLRALSVAVTALLLVAGGLGAGCLFLSRWAEARLSPTEEEKSREPFLACATGGLLAMTLIGTFHYVLAAESVHQRKSVSQRIVTQAETAMQKPRERQSITQSRPQVKNPQPTGFDGHFVAIELVAVLLLTSMIGALLVIHRSGNSQPISLSGPRPSAAAINADARSTRQGYRLQEGAAPAEPPDR